MKFGFVLPNNWGIDDPVAVAEIGVEAEAVGLDSVWVNHHIVNGCESPVVKSGSRVVGPTSHGP